jgi:hypothetical protein
MTFDQARLRMVVPVCWAVIIAGIFYSLYDRYHRLADCHAMLGRQAAVEARADDQSKQLEGMLGGSPR